MTGALSIRGKVVSSSPFDSSMFFVESQRSLEFLLFAQGWTLGRYSISGAMTAQQNILAWYSWAPWSSESWTASRSSLDRDRTNTDKGWRHLREQNTDKKKSHASVPAADVVSAVMETVWAMAHLRGDLRCKRGPGFRGTISKLTSLGAGKRSKRCMTSGRLITIQETAHALQRPRTGFPAGSYSSAERRGYILRRLCTNQCWIRKSGLSHGWVIWWNHDTIDWLQRNKRCLTTICSTPLCVPFTTPSGWSERLRGLEFDGRASWSRIPSCLFGVRLPWCMDYDFILFNSVSSEPRRSGSKFPISGTRKLSSLKLSCTALIPSK